MSRCLIKTIKAVVENRIEEKPQSTTVELPFTIHDSLFTIKHAPKISTETCKIDWNKTTEEVYNLIRGLSPHPTAFTYLHSKIFKIFLVKKNWLRIIFQMEILKQMKKLI